VTQSFLMDISIIFTDHNCRSLHDWRGCDPGCPVAKTYCFCPDRIICFMLSISLRMSSTAILVYHSKSESFNFSIGLVENALALHLHGIRSLIR
jgi:hypothetical protein